MKKLTLIVTFIIACLLGYVWKILPTDISVGFPYNTMVLSLQWYAYLLGKEITIALLAWSLFYFGVPKEDKILRYSAIIYCLFLTIEPINFILIYYIPFDKELFAIKATTSIVLLGIFYITERWKTIWRWFSQLMG